MDRAGTATRYAYTLTSGLGDWLPPKGVPTINALVVDGVLRAHGAHRRRRRARAWRRRPSGRDYDALFGQHPTRLQRAVPRQRTASTARRRTTPFVADRPDPAARLRPRCPAAQRAAVAERLADDIMNEARRPRIRRRDRRALRAAGADCDRPRTTSRSRSRPRPTSRAGATGPTRSASRRSARTGRPTRARGTTTSSARSSSGSTRTSPGSVRSSPATPLSNTVPRYQHLVSIMFLGVV